MKPNLVFNHKFTASYAFDLMLLVFYWILKWSHLFQYLPSITERLNGRFRAQCQPDRCRICGRNGSTPEESNVIEWSECCFDCGGGKGWAKDWCQR
jgi:hypothetical protein